jgi:cystathionine beta-lyase
MLKYIEGNVRLVEQYCKENIPAVKPLRPEASFLVWLNCQELRLTQEQLVDLFVNKAKLALNNGEMFGEEGRGFMRMNVALPRSVLQKALQQLKSAVESL